jgi:hypothetical protein
MSLVSGIKRMPKAIGAAIENRPGNGHEKLPMPDRCAETL